MKNETFYLASDNWAPAHPKVVEAVVEANQGNEPAYGDDNWTIQSAKLLESVFKKKCTTYFIPTGTGSNVLALRLGCKPFESTLCSDIAHIANQESGAPEAVVGCKLLTIPHINGKITPQAVSQKVAKETAIGKHSTSPRVLSITQPTEIGTVYTIEELRELSKVCKEENLLMHMDGSRLYNAAAFLKVELHEITDAANLDILSLGGTKLGLIGAEALIIFNPELKEGSQYLQKQTLQLCSKMRFLSAQFPPLFKEDLWRKLACHANEKAQEIAQTIASIPELTLNSQVETNQIFFSAPDAWHKKLQDKIHCYPWDEEKNEFRFITSWNTSDEEVQGVKAALLEIASALSQTSR